MQPVRHPARRQPPARPGFTLIELLVVMVVIAILIGLLIPVVSSAMSRARETQVVAEMSSFDASLVNFKSKFGVDVPSFMVLYEQGDDIDSNAGTPPPDPSWGADTTSPLPGTQDAYRRTSRAIIRQIWPDFDFATLGDSAANPAPSGRGNPTAGNGSRDLNDDGDETDVLVLDGSECLMFFLGGVAMRGPDVDPPGTPISETMDDDVLVGFAANPTDPFNSSSSNNRVGPYFENFSVDRFTDFDEDGMPEYRDPLPGQIRPYIYLSGYGGNGYKPFGLDNNLATVEDNEIPHDATLATVMDDGYYKTAGPPKTYLNPQSYQLISPGADNSYGTGGVYTGAALPPARASERDNITNFQKGRLD